MKNLKKLLPLILMLALMPCLTLSASATTLPDDTVTAPLEVVFAQENSYLYWADDLGAGSPEIVYDCHTQQYYLRFQLDTASKLADLLVAYPDAFRLRSNLDMLIDLNNANVAIWDKPDWRDKSIGTQLSKSTQTALKAMKDLDTYEALKLIESSPEYQSDEKLREQVNYAMSMLKSYRLHVLKGLSQLTAATDEPLVLAKVASTPSEVIEMAEGFLKKYPDLAVLHEAYTLALSGITSKYLTTFRMADTDKVEELWQRTLAATTYHWQDKINSLETFSFAVPFPEGTVYQWPTEWSKPEGLTPLDSFGLPTSATGG